MTTTYKICGNDGHYFILPTNSVLQREVESMGGRFCFPLLVTVCGREWWVTHADAEVALAQADADEAERQAEMAESRKARALARKQQAAEAAADFEVGKILVAIWGYDQTNVDAWQIVERRGVTCLTLRKVRCAEVEGTSGRDCCYVRPVKDGFVEDVAPLRKRISGGGVKIDESRRAYPMREDETYYCSWYA